MRSRTSFTTAATPSLKQALAYFVRLLIMARSYWGGISRGLLLGLIVGLVGLISPYLSKLYFDNVYPAHDFALLHVIVIGAATLAIASALMGGLRAYYTQVVGSRLSTAVGLMYFNHLQHLPIRFYDEHRVGEVMSRLGDVRGSLGTITRVFQTLLVNGVYLILVPPFLILLSWKLSLIALVTTPANIAISTASSRIVRKFMKQNAEASAELSAIQIEVLSQIRTFKSMALEHQVFADAREQAQDVLKSQLKAASVTTLIGIVNAVVRAVGLAVFSWYAWTLILEGSLTIGGFVAFTAYLAYLTGPVGQVAGLFADFQQTAVTLGRAFEYLDLATEQDPALAYAPPLPLTRILVGHISLSSVSFGYSPDHRILHGLELDLRPGTVTALVGQSGAGKSSLLRLLCRMSEPDEGTITFDGLPLSGFPLSEVRRQVAVVWQEPTLFRGTIWENLAFGQKDISREAVDDAMRACILDDLIAELPGGYDTPVAEWGATLSGGQRQRFTIARALLRAAPILLLDEVTSQVDVRTEEKMLRELLIRVTGKTVVFATHRMASAAIADQVCVLDHGRIVELGSHVDLSKAGGHYSEMLRMSQAGETRPVRMLGVT